MNANRLSTLPMWIGLAIVVTAVAPEPPLLKDLSAVDPMVSARIENAWRATVQDPENGLKWLDLAKTYHAHELTGLAEECYRQAVVLAPGDAKAWYLLALARHEIGEPVAALETLESAASLAPTYAPLSWREGRWLLETGDPVAAEYAFRRATEIDADDLAGWVGLAQIMIQDERSEAALGILFRVLAADQKNGVAGQLLGNAYRALGDDAAARRALAMSTGMGAHFPDPWYEEMLASATGVGNLLRLLSSRLERGDVDAVVSELEDLRQDHPTDVGVLNKLSEGYLYQRQPDAAKEILEEALVLSPGEFATLMHLSQASQQEGDLEAALYWVDLAEAANPRHWQVYFERATVLGRMNRYPECLVALEAAMNLGANQNPNAWLMQGDLLLRVGDWQRASETFQQACLRFPYLGNAFLGYAVALAEQGAISRARQALEEARILQVQDETMTAVLTRIEEIEKTLD